MFWGGDLATHGVEVEVEGSCGKWEAGVVAAEGGWCACGLVLENCVNDGGVLSMVMLGWRG